MELRSAEELRKLYKEMYPAPDVFRGSLYEFFLIRCDGTPADIFFAHNNIEAMLIVKHRHKVSTKKQFERKGFHGLYGKAPGKRLFVVFNITMINW